MCDDDIHVGRVDLNHVSRRSFGAGLAVAGLAGEAFAQAKAVEKAVSVKTPDGMADAYLIYPQGKGPWPGVIMWPDAMGLRPVFNQMASRLAAQGYVVLVPNPYYRTKKAPVFEDSFDFANPADRAKIGPMRAPMTDEAVARDAKAYVAFLDAQPQVNKARKVGVQGYCMGGTLSFHTAHAVPGRIGAVGSFHGGGLVTATPASPHLMIPHAKAQWLVAIGQNDDKSQPDAKDVLKKAFAAAGAKAEVEVYPADHGWCVPGSPAYSEAAAEKAWARLTSLYKTALA